MKKSELRRLIREEVQRVLTESAPSIETSQYVASHGKEPKGNGNWAFQLRKDRNDRNGEMFWPSAGPGAMPFAKALAMAKKEAAEIGDIGFIYVMP